MTERVDPQAAMQMATDIVIAYLGKRSVEPAELPALVREIRAALSAQESTTGDGTDVAASLKVDEVTDGPAQMPAPPPTPAVPVSESVTPDYLISLEDGKAYRSLKRHLMAKYGMTPEDYRSKWGLPADYPLVAPNYAAQRSSIAKSIGLGRSATKANSA